MNRSKTSAASPDDDLRRQLLLLKLPFILEHFEELAQKAGSEQWSHVEFLARLIEGSYPNYQQVIPATNDRKMTVAKEAFVKGLRRVSVISRDRSNAVKVDIAPGVLTLTASNPDLGEASDEVTAEYEGEALAIGYNARYLLDALQAMSGENVRVELKDQLSPTLIKEADDESYKCVVMPMRI